jgi:outer membrane immunogenic protein
MASRNIHGDNKMTDRWLKGVVIVALMAVGTAAVQAADLPTKKEVPAPVFVPPPFTWTGFYVGANVGGAWTSGSRSAQIFAPGAFPFPISTFFPAGNFGSGQSGVIGGGQAGYNWQYGAFVLGVETDFDGTSLSKTFNSTGVPFTGAGVPAFLLGDTLSVHAKASLDWLGSTRGRVGWATWDNRLLIYGTGGVAYGGGSANFSAFDATQGLFLNGNPSSSRVGWVAGGGVEYALTNNWTIRGEYLYYNLGKSTFTTAPAVLAGFTGVFANGQFDYRAQAVRAAVNSKF